MLAALILVAAVLYFQGYWEPREESEQPKGVIVAEIEPRELHWNLEQKLTRPGDSRYMLSEPTPVASDQTAQRINELADRALQSYNDGNFDLAVILFSELSREDDRAFLGLGMSYYRLGDYRSAVQYLEQSIGAKGIDEFQVRKILAFTYYRLDDLTESLNNANAGLAIRSDSDLKDLIAKLTREQSVQDGFIAEDTLNFKVLFDGYEFSDQGRIALNILEEAYGKVGVQLNQFPRDPITVILYSGKDFYDVTQMPDWTGGMYDGKIRIPLKGIEKYDTESLRKTLYHEYAHALIFSITKTCPLWVNEGLAVYLSGAQRQLVGQEIPLKELESSFPRDKDRGRLAYDVSYSAVSHLINKYGVHSFNIFLTGLDRGEDMESAFRSAFFTSYTEFADTWGKE